MSEQLPKFEDLSAVEVNDMIATEIMQWVKFEGQIDGKATGRYAWRGTHTIRVRAEFDGPGQASDIFNPYHDLNDCHLAESILMSIPWNQEDPGDHPFFNYGNWLDHIVRQENEKGFYSALHATAKQKSHALLKAKGLVR